MRNFDPFRELERIFDEDWVPMFPAMRRRMMPAADVSETNTDVIVELDVPKTDPKKVEITIEDQMLTVQGGEDTDQEEKGKNFYRREIRKGRFSRMIELPTAVKGEKATAEYHDGILKITIPKTAPRETKKIKVEVK